MTNDKAVTDMIRSYLYAVELGLPRQLRGDVVKELQTLIEDKLEDRAERLAKPIDTALAAFVLQEIGEPGEVARRYDTAPQYLVGPLFYPAFIKVVKIGLLALGAMLLLTTALGRAFSGAEPASLLTLSALTTLLGHYLQSAITLFGVAVLILAVVERTSWRRLAPKPSWDPRDLPEPPESEEDRVSSAGLAVDICVSVLLGVLLNVFPQWIGILIVPGPAPRLVPLADLGIRLPVAWINVWLAASLALALVVLRQQHWTRVTRWAQVARDLLAVAIVFQIAATSRAQMAAGTEPFRALVPFLNVGLFVFPLVLLIAPVRRAVRLIRGGVRPPTDERQ